MTAAAQGGSLDRLADGILLPPFPGPAAPRWVLRALDQGLAGVALFGGNVVTAGQLAALTGALRAAAAEPLIAIDEEGGDVTRLAHLTGSPYPGNAALGAVDDVDLTRAVYRALGSDLAAAGINLDLAPSVDVNTAAGNPVIGTRAFGDQAPLVARHAAAAVSGLQSAGVAACAKHFPGHGSTRVDTHRAVATVEGGLGQVRTRDLPPFAAAIAAGVAAVMPGHLRVPGLTGSLPASLSAAALAGLLRGELGFTGVIISDALEMRAVSQDGVAAAAVRATAAGVDLLCLGRDLDEEDYLAVRAAITAAVREGSLPEARLAEAAGRVAALRAALAAGQLPCAAAGSPPAARDRGAPGLAAARRAVRLSGTLPPVADPVVIEVGAAENMAAGRVPWGLGPWLPGGSVVRIAAGDGEGAASVVADTLAQAADRSLIMVVRNAHRDPQTQALVSAVLRQRPDLVVVEMGLPVWRPATGAFVATYGASRISGQAAAEVLGLTG